MSTFVLQYSDVIDTVDSVQKSDHKVQNLKNIAHDRVERVLKVEIKKSDP